MFHINLLTLRSYAFISDSLDITSQLTTGPNRNYESTLNVDNTNFTLHLNVYR